MSVSARHSPQVDQKVVEFMRQAGCFLEGWDPENEYNVVWHRQPIAQGDEGDYRFTTPEALKHDGYFYVSLISIVFGSGVTTGRQQLKEEVRRLLDPANR